MAPSINAFGQNFSSPFGGSSSIFGLSSSSFNNSGNTMSFTSSSGASSFGGNLAGFGEPGASNQRKGSQPAPYVTTAVEEDITRQLVSISAMLVYEDKSHEELRWDYYQNQNKGSTQTSTVLSGSSAPTAFGSHSNYGGTVSMPFGSTTSFGTTTNGSSIGQNSSGLFGTASMSSCSPFMSSSRTRTFLPFSTPSFVGTATPFSGFGEPGASNQRKGSQPAPYVTTAVKEDITRQLVSISAMRVYEDKSHEELRWDYYQNQNKGVQFKSCSHHGISNMASHSLTNGRHGGNGLVSYSVTNEVDNDGNIFGKLVSISAMPIYESRCHEELRWRDYMMSKGSNGQNQRRGRRGRGGRGCSHNRHGGRGWRNGGQGQAQHHQPGSYNSGGSSSSQYGTPPSNSNSVRSAGPSSFNPGTGILGPPPQLCQICGHPGHTALTCPHRFDQTSFPDPSQSFSTRSVQEPHDYNWYPDSGASNHMTSNPGVQSKSCSHHGASNMASHPLTNGRHGGNGVASYSVTNKVDNDGNISGKLVSISAMPIYKSKSHEELRMRDYMMGKGEQAATSLPGISSSFTNFQPKLSVSSPTNPSIAPSSSIVSGFTENFFSTLSSKPSATCNSCTPRITPFTASASSTSSLPFAPKIPTFPANPFNLHAPSMSATSIFQPSILSQATGSGSLGVWSSTISHQVPSFSLFTSTSLTSSAQVSSPLSQPSIVKSPVIESSCNQTTVTAAQSNTTQSPSTKPGTAQTTTSFSFPLRPLQSDKTQHSSSAVNDSGAVSNSGQPSLPQPLVSLDKVVDAFVPVRDPFPAATP